MTILKPKPAEKDEKALVLPPEVVTTEVIIYDNALYMHLKFSSYNIIIVIIIYYLFNNNSKKLTFRINS